MACKIPGYLYDRYQVRIYVLLLFGGVYGGSEATYSTTSECELSQASKKSLLQPAQVSTSPLGVSCVQLLTLRFEHTPLLPQQQRKHPNELSTSPTSWPIPNMILVFIADLPLPPLESYRGQYLSRYKQRVRSTRLQPNEKTPERLYDTYRTEQVRVTSIITSFV